MVVALQALGVGPGDEVIVPTYTWIATATAATMNGAIPIFADIDDTLGMNPESLRRVITSRTKAIIAVHMRGTPCDIEAIKAVADEKKLFLIEDNAQAFGSSVHGKMTGTFGIVGITSLGPMKTYTCSGQGGLVWTNDEALAVKIDWAVDHGLAAWGGLGNLPSYKRSFGAAETQSHPSGIAGGNADVIPWGMGNFRAPSEWHAAFARAELKLLSSKTQKLVGLKMAFRDALKPEYRYMLQRQADPGGDKGINIVLIFPVDGLIFQIFQHLERFGIFADPGYGFFPQHYLPYVKSLMNKVSFHPSGFPWVTEEDRRPLNVSDYNVSTTILQRSLQIQVSWHYTKPMMAHMAKKINNGLDGICAIHGACIAQPVAK
eukprot:gnl/TRDRNA2_/TRDRNA2_134391_c0_seq2.p1 gnl/TRDRNA2_/TRDRNA2_134391_c0~~gnl/TRDRNA2_/TRDRNA2_134391_c0_seq2.p1  ORF type:complete len:390 (-),score=71.57 gnl/TRDRNA2_/TRDRNA2_134391_c0_seq2:21-1145(-)